MNRAPAKTEVQRQYYQDGGALVSLVQAVLRISLIQPEKCSFMS